MLQVKTLIIILITLIVGFMGGFLLRPVIMPPPNSTIMIGQASAPAAATEARGSQYFEANIEEARQIIASCRNGSVRGGECANAQEAIIKVDAAERRKRFLGN